MNNSLSWFENHLGGCMDSTVESIVVNICGNEYSIKADVDIETTKQIAEFVNQKMMELKNGSLRDVLKIAVLSAMNIAGELYDYKEKYEITERKLNKIQDKAVNLSHKIENCIKD